MNEGGYRAKAGQSVRMLDLPVSEDFGAWNDLHGATSGAAFSDALQRGAAKHHGHAGRAFLEKLTRDKKDFCATLEEFKALPMFMREGGQGQDKRAAARFAIVGMAGEIATEYRITGWPEGAAIKAAAHGFKLWASLRGTGDGEQRQILRQVAAFIDRHGDGRFSSDKDNNHTSIKDRAGWWRDDVSGDREYLFNADGLREATKGFDFTRALDVLQAAGALTSPGLNKRSKAYRVGGRAVQLYAISTEKLEGGGNVA